MSDKIGYSDCWTYPKDVIDEKIKVSRRQYESYLEGIQEAGETAIESVEAKGEEVLETIPDDYSELVEDVSELKADFTSVKDVTVELKARYTDESLSTGWTAGYITLDGVIHSSSSYQYKEKIPCVPGDIFTATGFRFLCAYSSAGTAVVAQGKESKASYTVPEGIYFVSLSCTNANISSVVHKHIEYYYANIYDDEMTAVSAINDDYPNLERYLQSHNQINYLDESKLVSGYVSANGNVSSDSTRSYLPFLPVNPGDVIRSYKRETTENLLLVVDGYSAMYKVCAYNSNKEVVASAGTDSAAYSYTVPDGISFITVSIYNRLKNNLGMLTINYEADYYIPYGGWYTAKSEFLQDAFTEMTAQPKISKGFVKVTGNLASGESLTIPKTTAKTNQRYSFSADITQFSEIIIGNHKNGANGSWLRITSTNADVTLQYQNDATTYQHTHGLTITSFIKVEIVSAKDANSCDIFIVTDSGSYKIEDSAWYGYGNGDYFAESVGSTLTNCSFTFGCSGFRNNLWIFGDSYITYNSEARWVYYAKTAGWMDNFMLAGYPGEAPREGIQCIDNAIRNYGRPMYCVYALGMNGDADSGETVNSNYMAYMKQFLLLCKQFNVTPILCTIPTVPTLYHEPRNAWIRNSGYRYIDFAKAVGAQANGTWYTGMLSDDGVHPTVLGAKALFMQAVADCPEITFYK